MSKISFPEVSLSTKPAYDEHCGNDHQPCMGECCPLDCPIGCRHYHGTYKTNKATMSLTGRIDGTCEVSIRNIWHENVLFILPAKEARDGQPPEFVTELFKYLSKHPLDR